MRTLPITRADYITNLTNRHRIDWLDQFADRLQKQENSQSSNTSQQRSNSFVDEISAMLYKQPSNVKSPKTVAGIVKDYQDKIGLNDYLKTLQNIKQAQDSGIPSSLQNLPRDLQQNIIQYITNKIRTYHGSISIPAIQNEVLNTFRNQGVSAQEIESSEMAGFINSEIVKELQNHPHSRDMNMSIGLGTGTEDPKDNNQANTDAFFHLMPNKS